ncbi:hypothetical protein BDW60DRAFT_193363 [Aspergillus nidulans var. acristatus]
MFLLLYLVSSHGVWPSCKIEAIKVMASPYTSVIGSLDSKCGSMALRDKDWWTYSAAVSFKDGRDLRHPVSSRQNTVN